MKLTSSLLATAALLCATPTTTTNVNAIDVGEHVPNDLTLHYGFPPTKISLDERFANRKVLLVGLPGAFTPTCSSRQVPGYLANENELKMLGVDDVIIYCVNDGAVMEAWAINQGVSTTQLELNSNGKEEEDDDDDDDSFSSSSIIHLFGDPYGEVTESLDMELTAAGPKMKGLVQRCKRFALYIVNGKVEIKRIAEADNDPAGDDYPDITLAESMIVAITEFNNKSSSGGEEL